MRIFLLAFLVAFSAAPMAHAEATLVTDLVTMSRAQVVSVSHPSTTILPGTETSVASQTLTARILDGADAGREATFRNDYIQLAVGDTFYLRHTTNEMDGLDLYAVADPYRLPALAILAALFLLAVIVFGGIQGIRGLASLCGSILLIVFALIPGILHGLSPIWVSIGVSSAIIVVGSYVTHGFSRTTTSAVLGMIGTVCITGLGAYWAIHAAHLSGFSSEEHTYLNFDMRGHIDMIGLLFGGIMIGLLGVLYDVAIGQAIAVEELFRAGTHMDKLRVYTRAIRIGREHIGALVNTLAIAYVGAALPLLLLVQTSDYDLAFAINSEVFATEIIRILIGSIGIILAVPVTTAVATYMLAHASFSSTTSSHGHSHAH